MADLFIGLLRKLSVNLVQLLWLSGPLQPLQVSLVGLAICLVASEPLYVSESLVTPITMHAITSVRDFGLLLDFEFHPTCQLDIVLLWCPLGKAHGSKHWLPPVGLSLLLALLLFVGVHVHG